MLTLLCPLLFIINASNKCVMLAWIIIMENEGSSLFFDSLVIMTKLYNFCGLYFWQRLSIECWNDTQKDIHIMYIQVWAQLFYYHPLDISIKSLIIQVSFFDVLNEMSRVQIISLHYNDQIKKKFGILKWYVNHNYNKLESSI